MSRRAAEQARGLLDKRMGRDSIFPELCREIGGFFGERCRFRCSRPSHVQDDVPACE